MKKNVSLDDNFKKIETTTSEKSNKVFVLSFLAIAVASIAMFLTFQFVFRTQIIDSLFYCASTFLIGCLAIFTAFLLNNKMKGRGKYNSSLKLIVENDRKYKIVDKLKDEALKEEEINKTKAEVINKINEDKKIEFKERNIYLMVENDVQKVTSYKEFAFFVNNYFLDCGYKTTVGYALSASISLNKIILLDKNEHNDIFIDNINQCFNSPKLIIDASQNKEIIKDNTFFEAINVAKSFEFNPVLLIINNLTKDNIEEYLGSILGFLLTINKKYNLKFQDNEINMPGNLFFIINMNTIDLNDIGKSLIKQSTVIDFDCEIVEDKKEVVKPLLFNNFNVHHMLNEIKNREFLKEEYWKKVDAFEDFFNEKCNYEFDNRILTNLEGYVAIMLDEYNDQLKALDCSMANYILPSALLSLEDKSSKTKNELLALVDSLFADDEMIQVKKIINNYFDMFDEE